MATEKISFKEWLEENHIPFEDNGGEDVTVEVSKLEPYIFELQLLFPDIFEKE